MPGVGPPAHPPHPIYRLDDFEIGGKGSTAHTWERSWKPTEPRKKAASRDQRLPGVLIIEAMAQAGAVLLLHDAGFGDDKLIYITGIDAARFRRTVVPGDQLRLILEVVRLRSRTSRLKGRAEVDGQRVAEAEILSAMVDRESP